MQSGSARYRIDRTLPSRTTLDEKGLGYVSEASLTLAAKGQQDIYTLQSYVHSSEEASRFEQSRLALLADPADAFDASIRRWEDYLARGLSNQGIPESERRIAVKAMETLNGNWRSPAGAILHDGVTLQHRPLVRRRLGLGQLEARLRHGPLQPRGSQEQRARHV